MSHTFPSINEEEGEEGITAESFNASCAERAIIKSVDTDIKEGVRYKISKALKPGKKIVGRLKKVLTIRPQSEVAVFKTSTLGLVGLEPDITGDFSHSNEISLSSRTSFDFRMMNLSSAVDHDYKSPSSVPMSSLEDYRLNVHQLVLQQWNRNDHQQWNGVFENGSTEKKRLKKLQRKANLTKLQVSMIKFEVCIEIYLQHQQEHKLDAKIISDMFDKVLNLLNVSSNGEEVHDALSKFWTLNENLISSVITQLVANCDKILKDIQCNSTVESSVVLLAHIQNHCDNDPLRIGKDIMRSKMFSKYLEDLLFHFMKKADEWFNALHLETRSDQNSLEKALSQLTTSLVNELQLRQTYWKVVFERIHINIYNVVFAIWDEKLSLEIIPMMSNINSKLQPINVGRDSKCSFDADEFLLEEHLYKLFLSLNQLSRLAKIERIQLSKDSHSIVNCYHKLFSQFVSNWLNLTFLRNQTRISSAVDLDNLTSVTEISQLSTSAIDVSELLMKTNDFWNELAWPIIDEAYSFALIIVKNLDRCLHHYMETIFLRTQELERLDFENFEISDSVFTAFNNIDFVWNNVQTVIENLQIHGLIKSLRKGHNHNNRSSTEALTLSTLIESTAQSVRQKRLDMVVKIWQNNIEPMFLTLLSHCVEMTIATDFVYEKMKLVSHLTNLICKIEDKIAIPDVTSVISVIWKSLIKAFELFLETLLNNDNSTQLKFQHLQIILFDLEKVFENLTVIKKTVNIDESLQKLVDIDNLLKLKNIMRLHGSSTADLQIEYLTIRFREQCNTKVSSNDKGIGRLAIDVQFSQETEILHLEILHAVLEKGNYESYVKVQILTRDEENEQTFYTEVKKSKCPLFEKTFSINISNQDWNGGGMIRFSVKYRCILRAKTIVIGEAVLPFGNIIPISINNESNERQVQMRLTLTLAKESGTKSEILGILERRRGDTRAIVFAKSERGRYMQNN